MTLTLSVMMLTAYTGYEQTDGLEKSAIMTEALVYLGTGLGTFYLLYVQNSSF